MDWGKLLGLALPAAGKLLSGGSKGMQTSRENENVGNIARDRTALDAVGERERALEERAMLELKQRELDAKTRADGYGQTLRSQYAQSWSPASRPSRVPQTSGGFNTVPQSTRDFAAQYEQQAMARALQGQKFDALPPVERFVPTAVKQPSLWEKITGAAGLGLTATAALKAAMDHAGMNEDPYSGVPQPGATRNV